MIYASTETDPETGEETLKPLRTTLDEGDRLLLRTEERPQPHMRENAGFAGFIRPKWDDMAEAWVEDATAEEVAEWEAEHPAPDPPSRPPTNGELQEENKLLKAQLAATADRQEFLEDCIAEMAVQVYGV